MPPEGDLRMADTPFFVEEKIIHSVKNLLAGPVNELLGETEYPIPPIEFGTYRGGSVIAPVIALSTCEQTEKERIIRLDAYALTLTFTLPEYPEGERNGYAYAWAVATILMDDPTLGGIADRAVLTGKKYTPPKQSGTGGRLDGSFDGTPYSRRGWLCWLMAGIVPS
jgi:hypothetical protein